MDAYYELLANGKHISNATLDHHKEIPPQLLLSRRYFKQETAAAAGRLERGITNKSRFILCLGLV